MNSNDSMEHAGDDADWLRAFYHEAENDIRWAKERGNTITQLSVAIQAGIIALSNTIPVIPGWAFAVLSLAQAIGAAIWIIDLRRFAKKARDWIHDSLGKRVAIEYPRPRGWDRHHWLYMGLQLAIIVVATTVAWFAIAR